MTITMPTTREEVEKAQVEALAFVRERFPNGEWRGTAATLRHFFEAAGAASGFCPRNLCFLNMKEAAKGQLLEQFYICALVMMDFEGRLPKED